MRRPRRACAIGDKRRSTDWRLRPGGGDLRSVEGQGLCRQRAAENTAKSPSAPFCSGNRLAWITIYGDPGAAVEAFLPNSRANDCGARGTAVAARHAGITMPNANSVSHALIARGARRLAIAILGAGLLAQPASGQAAGARAEQPLDATVEEAARTAQPAGRAVTLAYANRPIVQFRADGPEPHSCGPGGSGDPCPRSARLRNTLRPGRDKRHRGGAGHPSRQPDRLRDAAPGCRFAWRRVTRRQSGGGRGTPGDRLQRGRRAAQAFATVAQRTAGVRGDADLPGSALAAATGPPGHAHRGSLAARHGSSSASRQARSSCARPA